MKTLVVSRSFPPAVNGTSTQLRNIFKHFPRDSYCVLMGNVLPHDPDSRLDCKIFTCDLPSKYRYAYKAHFFLIPVLVSKLLRIVKQEKVDNLLAVFPHMAHFISSYLVHKITGRPLFICIHDIWEESQDMLLERLTAKKFEPRIFRSASKVFVLNEALQKLYWKKHGARPILIRNCADLPTGCTDNPDIRADDKRPYHIVFTGSIYSAQFDAIINLVNIVNTLSEKDVRLTICTRGDPQRLGERGIRGDNIKIQFVGREESLSLQRQADILFLPLAFNSASPIGIATALPMKTPEYLASGKPILVYAPSDYYLTRYAREKGWGLVVDQPDLQELKEAILRLLSDNELRRRLVRNARHTAADHDAVVISRTLQRYLLGEVKHH